MYVLTDTYTVELAHENGSKMYYLKEVGTGDCIAPSAREGIFDTKEGYFTKSLTGRLWYDHTKEKNPEHTWFLVRSDFFIKEEPDSLLSIYETESKNWLALKVPSDKESFFLNNSKEIIFFIKDEKVVEIPIFFLDRMIVQGETSLPLPTFDNKQKRYLWPNSEWKTLRSTPVSLETNQTISRPIIAQNSTWKPKHYFTQKGEELCVNQ